jgi:hypothetical protein
MTEGVAVFTSMVKILMIIRRYKKEKSVVMIGSSEKSDRSGSDGSSTSNAIRPKRYGRSSGIAGRRTAAVKRVQE